MTIKYFLKRKTDLRASTVSSSPQHAENVNPLGDVRPQEQAQMGFNAQELLATSAEAVPPWQRDVGHSLAQCQIASLERQDILKSLTKSSRFGVILDENGQVVQGNTGWTQHLAAIPILSVQAGHLVPVSAQSQQDLNAALKILFEDFNWPSVPVALRDLDGWVIDIIHLKRVGNANPNRAYAVLPKSSIDLSTTLATLGMALKLTPLEITFVRLVVNGQSEREMATALSLKQSEIKTGIRDLIAKFRVRQKSDIVRIVSSFP